MMVISWLNDGEHMVNIIVDGMVNGQMIAEDSNSRTIKSWLSMVMVDHQIMGAPDRFGIVRFTGSIK